MGHGCSQGDAEADKNSEVGNRSGARGGDVRKVRGIICMAVP